jgi:Protein of unknown function (DUF3383)
MSAAIPASALVNIVPGVISPGGNALQLSGLFLTTNTRVPIGTVPSYPSAAAVSTAFGPSSAEAAAASIYFNGFAGSTAKPGALLFAQYPTVAVAPYLRGGSLAALTLAQLQAVNGSLNVTVNGVARSAPSVNLSTATSFSNAASLIQTAFGPAYDAVTTNTATITAAAATVVTASITGNIMTVTGVTSGVLVPGGVLSGTGVTSNTAIVSQLTGIAGGTGTYLVSAIQNVASTAISQSAGLLTVGGMVSGTLAVGQSVSGAAVAAGTTITALGTGTGGVGTYYTSGGAQAVSATTMSCGLLTVTFDSIASAFVITGGTPGAAGTIGFATGTVSATLNLTAATGAVLSQGAAAATPGAFMSAVLGVATNWATFMTLFDPDGGYGNAQKQLFAAWAGGSVAAQNYAYIAWDTDVNPTLGAAPASLGAILAAANTSGTTVVGGAVDNTIAAFICGTAASINFAQKNGRISFAFKSASGLVPTATSLAVANNLTANGYAYYGTWATAAAPFIGLGPTGVSGPFKWLDNFVNQVWLNNNFQLALMTLLFNSPSIPYTQAGYGAIRTACVGTEDAPGPILQGVNFGAFAAGVPLSGSQIAQVNAAAGVKIDDVLFAQGWYLQILPASPTSRASRGTPPMTFWYNNPGAVQALSLASIEVE